MNIKKKKMNYTKSKQKYESNLTKNDLIERNK